MKEIIQGFYQKKHFWTRLILVIAARVTMPRYATHGGVGAGGIIALVCAIVCLVIGVAVGVLFPEGLILSLIHI